MQKSYIQIIRELREDSDRTQQEIADYLGTSQTMTVSSSFANFY